MGDLGQVFSPSWIEWLLVIELLGLAALPIAALLFRAFPDRGYAMAKPLGILLVAFVNWWLGSVASLANYPQLLWVIVLLMAAGGGVLYWLGILARPTDLRSFARIAAIEEILFLVAFLVWTLVRSQSPDIYETEKPMDFMLLQVSGMSHSFPPPDAWLSGHTVNYYYLGYAIFAMIGKMATVDPRVGFNLANITIFALGASCAYGLALALTKNLRWAFVGTFTLVLAGNLDGVAQAVGQIRNGGLNESGLSLWCSTRVVDGGCGAYHSITEFPIFSLIWNDLHPHVMDIPFVLLAIAFGIHAIVDPPALDRAAIGKYLRLAGPALALGALFAINSWDYPAITIFVVGSMVLGLYRHGTPAGEALAHTLAVVPVSLIIYVPYFLTVHSKTGIGFVANPSALGDVLTVIGGVVIVPAIYVAWRAASALSAGTKSAERLEMPLLAWLLRPLPLEAGWWVAYGVLVVAFFMSGRVDFLYAIAPVAGLHSLQHLRPAGSGWWIIFGALVLTFVWSGRTDFLYVVGILLGIYVLSVHWRAEQAESLVTLLLTVLGLTILLAGDFVYLRDNFDGSANYRMNTIFKLFYQAWILLAVATPYALFSITRVVRERGPQALRWIWYGLAIGLAVCMAVYPIEGVGSQTQSAAFSATLDGLAYMRDVNPDAYAAISWVRANTKPSDVVAEVFGSDYWVDGIERAQFSSNQMSALTGRATIVGWPYSHEALWRGDYGGGSDAAAVGTMLAQREADVTTLYTTTNKQTAMNIIRKYHVNYLYVGPFEQATFGTNPASLAKFQTFLTVVVKRPAAMLYRVPAGL
jgi:YYY domain-containing protein